MSVDKIPTRVARRIPAPKTVPAVFPRIHGTIFIDWLPPGEKSNSGYFYKIFEQLSEVLHSGSGACSPMPTVHFDNAIPYRSAVSKK
jgi:hypothetical protein